MKFPIFILVCFLLVRINGVVYSQEYPYEINQYQDIEKNPTFTLNEVTNNTFEYFHNGFLPGTNKFNSDKISYKHYFESIFSGAGIFFSRCQANDSVNYMYAGISVAYRNILFDKVYVKLGLAYKYIYNKSTNGIYDDHYFYTKDSSIAKNSYSNFNASIAFTSPSDYYFISAVICNVNFNSEKSPFLVQYNINAGNLFSLLNAQRNNYCSITYLQNSTVDGKFYSRGYFSTLYTTLIINRRTSIRIGVSGGYLQNKYYNISPLLFFVKKKFALSFSYQYFIPYKTFVVPTKYIPQLNIIIKL